MTDTPKPVEQWEALCKRLLDVRWWTIRSVQVDELDKEFFDACQDECDRLEARDHTDAAALRDLLRDVQDHNWVLCSLTVEDCGLLQRIEIALSSSQG